MNVDAAVAAATISAYALALSLAILPFGALADRLGVVRISAAGFVLFTAFSIGCALAPSIDWLIALRALTGIAAAMLQATAASFVSRYVDGRRRGAAFGWVSSILSCGLILGPSAGGFIVSFVSWRWIFLAAVPFGIAGLVTNWRLRDEATLSARDTQSAVETPLGPARIAPFAGAVALGAIFIAVFVGSSFELTPLISASIAAKLSGIMVQRGLGLATMLGGRVACGAIPCALLLFGVGTGSMQTPVIALSLAAFPAGAQSRAERRSAAC